MWKFQRRAADKLITTRRPRRSRGSGLSCWRRRRRAHHLRYVIHMMFFGGVLFFIFGNKGSSRYMIHLLFLEILWIFFFFGVRGTYMFPKYHYFNLFISFPGEFAAGNAGERKEVFIMIYNHISVYECIYYYYYYYYYFYYYCYYFIFSFPNS